MVGWVDANADGMADVRCVVGGKEAVLENPWVVLVLLRMGSDSEFMMMVRNLTKWCIEDFSIGIFHKVYPRRYLFREVVTRIELREGRGLND
jgi:hypothetical protein